MNKKPVILFTSPVIGFPSIGGPELRIENSIKALNKISELIIFSRNYLPARSKNHFRTLSNTLYIAPSIKSKYLLFIKRIINKISKILFKKHIFIFQNSQKDFSFILKIIKRHQADVVWLGYGNISFALFEFLKKNTSVPVVVDSDSVWSRFVLRALPYAHNESEKQRIKQEGLQKEIEEKTWTQTASVTTAVSEIDADYYRSLTTKPETVFVFSNVIDLKNYEKNYPRPQNTMKPYIYLAGSFGPRSPMEDAAKWMIDEVLPKLWQTNPDIHFVVVGHGSKETLKEIQSPQIHVLGKVESVLPYLKNAEVVVVPLRFESGTRFKILEAGACGIPIVSTTLGAEGIPVQNEKDILIADEPSHFAESILKIIKDKGLATKLSSNMKNLVNQSYSVDSLAQEGQKILGYLHVN